MSTWKNKEREKLYNAREDVKKRRREQSQRPEAKANRKKYYEEHKDQWIDRRNTDEAKRKRREYYQRPEVKQRIKDRQKTPEWQEYHKTYRNSEHGKNVFKEWQRKRIGFANGMYKKLMEIQNNRCAICQRPFDSMSGKNIHADHDHSAKKARGILCQQCNHAEGIIRATGLTPYKFAKNLEHYLKFPPSSKV
jgi:hypothetical protein